MMRLRVRLLAVVAVLAAVVALLIVLGARAPVDPAAWTPAPPRPLTGALEPDEALRAVELYGGDLAGPEDVAIDDRGRIYTGVENGDVLRLEAGPSSGVFEVFASTGGRPLGLDFDDAGTLWVADTARGLLSVDRDGQVKARSVEAAGTPFIFADDVDAGPNGKVYFSDASSRFGPDEIMNEALEARPHGRLLEYDSTTGETRVLLDGLYFANGVAVAPDASFVLVAETFRYRIRRLWLAGPRAGQDEVLVDELPGFPDGVASDGENLFWVAFYAPRSDALDRHLHPRPWLKRLVAMLPEAVQKRSDAYGLVLAIDGEGRIVESLHDPGGETMGHITSVEPVGSELWLGTVEGRSIGRYVIR